MFGCCKAPAVEETAVAVADGTGTIGDGAVKLYHQYTSTVDAVQATGEHERMAELMAEVAVPSPELWGEMLKLWSRCHAIMSFRSWRRGTTRWRRGACSHKVTEVALCAHEVLLMHGAAMREHLDMGEVRLVARLSEADWQGVCEAEHRYHDTQELAQEGWQRDDESQE